MRHRISRELQRLDIRIAHLLEKECSIGDASDITGTNGQLISFLLEHEDDPVYQKDIEKAFGITRSTASRVLSLMEKKNLIERSCAAHDARLKRVTLTDRSRAFASAMLSDFDVGYESYQFENNTYIGEDTCYVRLRNTNPSMGWGGSITNLTFTYQRKVQ